MLALDFKTCGCQGHRPTASFPLGAQRDVYVEKTGETYALMLLKDKQYESGPYLELTEVELKAQIAALIKKYG